MGRLGKGVFIVSVLVGLVAVFLSAYYHTVWFSPFCVGLSLGCPEVEVGGFVAPGWEEVKEKFTENILTGTDLGSQLSIYHNGEEVVHLYGGIADRKSGRKYDEKTLQVVFSSTKVMTSLVVAMLADRGLIDYDEKIATYWPEFAQNGKEHITVAELMQHSAGLHTPDGNYTLDTLEGWKKGGLLSKIFEKAAPDFPELTKRVYHGITRGWIVNEIVQRVDPKGRSIGQFIAEEICPKIDVEFYLGTLTKERADGNLATLETQPFPSILVEILLPHYLGTHIPFFDTLTERKKKMLEAHSGGATKDYIQRLTKQVDSLGGLESLGKFDVAHLEIPSAGGFTSAWNVAKIGSILANGGSNNIGTLLSEKGFKMALGNPVTAYDILMANETTFVNAGWAFMPGGFTGWGGYGGSVFLWNEGLNMSFGYTMNGLRAFEFAAIGDPLKDIAIRIAAAKS